MKLTRSLAIATMLTVFAPVGYADAPNGDSSSAAASGPSMAAAVRMRVPGVEFKAVPLTDVIDFMRDTAQLNIFVNWPALEAAGIDRSTPISIQLHQIQLSKVLDLTLGEVSAGHSAITWYVSDNIIYITTRELADRDLITQIYPVQDLLVDIPNFVGPTFQLGGSSGGGGGQGGGGSIFNGSGNTNNTQDTGTMQERGEKLVALIMMLVEPEVWVENGGFSRIRYFNGNLIVTAPRSVQALIGK